MMKWLEVDWHGDKTKIPVQKINGHLWFHLEGETFSWEIPGTRKKGAQSKAHKNGEITAPMPGKILKVFVEQGKKVKVGDSVIAMEAMKMEYTLVADIDGEIIELNIKNGDQVTLGQHLAQIADKG